MDFVPGSTIVFRRLHQAGSEKPPSTISVWPRTISGVRRAEERDRGRRCRPARRAGPPGCARGRGEHLLLVREVVERARLDDAAGDGVDADAARRELDGEVAHDRLERRLRRADEDVVLEHALRAEARDRRRSRSPPASTAPRRARASSARAFAFSVQSQCLSSVSSAGRITPVAALWTSASSGPSSATSPSTRSDETLPRTSTGSAPAARISSAVSSAARSLRR